MVLLLEKVNGMMLHSSCVQLDVKAQDWQDAIRKACRPLMNEGFVTEGYDEDVIARELQWATGLPTEPVGVAIPHSLTPQHVITAQIAACRLSQPVKFAQSGGTADDGKVDVSIIFVLALKDPKEQLSLLQKLMAAISNEEMLASLMGTSAPLEFSNIFNGASAE